MKRARSVRKAIDKPGVITIKELVDFIAAVEEYHAAFAPFVSAVRKIIKGRKK